MLKNKHTHAAILRVKTQKPHHPNARASTIINHNYFLIKIHFYSFIYFPSHVFVWSKVAKVEWVVLNKLILCEVVKLFLVEVTHIKNLYFYHVIAVWPHSECAIAMNVPMNVVVVWWKSTEYIKTIWNNWFYQHTSLSIF